MSARTLTRPAGMPYRQLAGQFDVGQRLVGGRVQFIIVATDELTPVGRQLAHALSLHEEHSGTYWSLKYYEDNEASLAKQPVVFLGDSKVARTYSDVLPQRFSDYGTTCSFEGSKAVLSVETPNAVSVDELARLGRVVEGRAEELRHIAETTVIEQPGPAHAAAGKLGTAAGLTPPGVRVALALQPVFNASRGAIQFIVRTVNSRNRRRAYNRLQYRYVLDRFLAEEFNDFVAGVDGH